MTTFPAAPVGVDQSHPFIEAARRFADVHGVGDRVDFRVGDAHDLDFPEATFDAAFAHTLISHVADPQAVLGEMVRVVRPGSIVAIFDGDYSSMTYAMPDHDLGHRMDVALTPAAFNNPHIMRDLPRLMPQLGLQLQQAWCDAVVEIGKASYFRSFAETYAPYIVKSGMFSAEAVDAWLAAQNQAMADGRCASIRAMLSALNRRRIATICCCVTRAGKSSCIATISMSQRLPRPVRTRH